MCQGWKKKQQQQHNSKRISKRKTTKNKVSQKKKKKHISRITQHSSVDSKLQADLPSSSVRTIHVPGDQLAPVEDSNIFKWKFKSTVEKSVKKLKGLKRRLVHGKKKKKPTSKQSVQSEGDDERPAQKDKGQRPSSPHRRRHSGHRGSRSRISESLASSESLQDSGRYRTPITERRSQSPGSTTGRPLRQPSSIDDSPASGSQPSMRKRRIHRAQQTAPERYLVTRTSSSTSPSLLSVKAKPTPVPNSSTPRPEFAAQDDSLKIKGNGSSDSGGSWSGRYYSKMDSSEGEEDKSQENEGRGGQDKRDSE